MQKIYVEGHRGWAAKYPENTLLSFEKAIELGVDAVEFDVWLTSDKAPVLMHDGNPLRTCGVDGHLRDMTLAQVKTLDPCYRDKFGEEFAGQVQIPTLYELLELVKNTRPDLKLGVEIKEYTEECVDITVAALKQYGKLDDCWFYAFNGRIIRYLREKYGARTMGYPDMQMKEFDGYDAYEEIGLSMGYVKSELCAFYRAKGMPIHMFCADNAADVWTCIRRGADLITANDPPALLEIVRRGEPPCALEAHRGVGTDAPENTLPAFYEALWQGYSMIECDTKFTADDVCVFHHDRTVNRTGRLADGAPITAETPISSLTLAELKALDFGMWKDEKYAKTRILTFEDGLRFALDNRIPIKLDNVMQSHAPHQQKLMLDMIERMGAIDYVGFTANSLPFISMILARFPGAQIHFDGDPTDENLAALSKILPKEQLTVWLRYPNARTAWCKMPPVSPELAAKVKTTAKLGVWLITTPEEYAEAVALGADIAETDGALKPMRV